MLWLGLALLTACATALKDLLNKQTLREASGGFVAWALVTVTAPLLALIALLLPWPTLGPLFFPAIGLTVALYVVAVLLYMKALEAADLSLTLPMIAFTPVFMLITGPLVLGERPRPLGLVGVLVIVIGAYVLKLEDLRRGVLEPFLSLAREPGTRAMLAVALIFSVTSTTVKLSVSQSSPVVTMASLYGGASLVLTVVMLGRRSITRAALGRHWRALLMVGLLSTLAEVCLAYSLSMALAVYVISIKRLSILFGALLGFLILRERNLRSRLAGAAVMLTGLLLIALSEG